MPLLYILAGPNGAGKTTFYESNIHEGFINSLLPFINVDLIVRNELGSYNEENFAKAESLYRERVSNHINAEESFMIESNLAREADYKWIESMKRKGYEVILYFLCTEYVEENISRVKKRVKEGGHDVPETIIRDRYRMAIIYLRTRLHQFKEAYLLDNSENTVQQIAVLKCGVVQSPIISDLQWVKDLLYIVNLMQKRHKIPTS
jgi:predicted ABC-type ATPase